MFGCMVASLKNVCTAIFGITYTVYFILGTKQTACLR
jgi:hypothetical protein